MSEEMKALRKVRSETGAELINIPVPDVREGTVLVKVKLAAICGTDKAIYGWSDHMAKKSKPPFTMGHEYCGEVVAVGENVNHISMGDYVVGETHVPCGECYMCQVGSQHVCINMKNVGRSYDGCFAEYILIPENCVVKIPKTIDYNTAAMLEPFGVAVHALQKTAPCGEVVVVLGCGSIGLMTVAVSKLMGAFKVYVIGRTDSKLKIAMSMGADKVFNTSIDNVDVVIKEVTNGNGADVVIEASGSNEAFSVGLEILKNQGRFCLVGVPSNPILFDSDRYLIRKELNITGIWGRRMYSTWLLVKQFISSGAIDLKPLIGNEYPLEKFETAFKEALSGTVQRIFLKP